MAKTDEITRREALKLAAAVAALGTALGMSASTAGAQGPTTLQQKVKPERQQMKLSRFELKLYDGEKLLHTCMVPGPVLTQIKIDRRIEYKWFRDGQIVAHPNAL